MENKDKGFGKSYLKTSKLKEFETPSHYIMKVFPYITRKDLLQTNLEELDKHFISKEQYDDYVCKTVKEFKRIKEQHQKEIDLKDTNIMELNLKIDKLNDCIEKLKENK